MKDPRHEILAELLVNHSCSLQKGESVLISATDIPHAMVESLIEKVYKAGGRPSIDLRSDRLKRALLKGASGESLDSIAGWERFRMEQMDAYIGVRGYENPKETSDLPPEANQLFMKHIFDPVHRQIRVPKTKWVVLRYPTPAMAMMAGMSTEGFEEFFFDVCTKVDYKAMEQAMIPARQFLEKSREVHIEGPGTDISFSIEGIPAVPCFGKRNIPDGEIYTAPVRNSVQGHLSCNTSTTYFGATFKDIVLTFKDGRIIDAAANDTEHINAVFDTDEGARYIGEFAMGCNPYIHDPFDETLFDEKIRGSFHFTPGSAYETADNGNRSVIHWDMVYIQRPEYGGGTIRIDGELIRDNGIFVHDAFAGLNPEHLTRSS